MKITLHSTIKALALAAAVTFGGTSVAPAGLLISGGTNFGLYNDTGGLIQMYATNLSDARGVAVDPSGNSYVADYGSGNGTNSAIRMYDSSGSFVRNVMTNAYYGLRPNALTWNPAYGGLALTADGGGGPYGGTMAVLNVSGNNTNVGFTINPYYGTGYFGLAYVEKTGAGHANDLMYASANDGAGTGYYQYFDPATQYLGNFASPPTASGLLAGIGVKDVALDANDLAFVANQATGVLVNVSANGTTTTLVTGLNQPTGVAYSAALDNLFIANHGNSTVSQYNLSGTQIGSSFAVTGGANYIAYTAVPEPSTFAMLGLGALTTVMILRKRRRA